MKTSILIADDHILVRETWSFILNHHPKFVVIAEVGSANEAIEKARELIPDVVLMDINLPDMSGIEATEIIHREMPQCKILGVSLHAQPAYAKKIMHKGALGYITKNSLREEMFEAIESISNGHTFICKEIKDILAFQILQGEETLSGVDA